MAAFDAVETAGEAVAAIISAGILPAGLEMMDTWQYRPPRISYTPATLPMPRPYCCVNWTAPTKKYPVKISEVRSLLNARVPAKYDRAGRTGTAALLGRAQGSISCRWTYLTGLLLHGRHHSAQTPGKGTGNYQPVVRGISATGCECVSRRRRKPASADSVRCQQTGRTGTGGAVRRRILELSVSVGGTITGEHGVGMEKINQMCVQFNTAELTQFHAIKQPLIRRVCLTRARPSRHSLAVPSLAACMCTTANCLSRISNAFRNNGPGSYTDIL